MTTTLKKIVNSMKSLEIEYPRAVPAFYQIISSLCFALHFFSIKFLEGIPATQIIVYRSILTLVILQLLVLLFPCQSYPKSKGTIIKLMGRGIFGGIGFIGSVLALKLTVISEAVVLMKTNPLWTTLLMVYIYKTERMTFRTIFEIALCLFGVALITKPPFLLNILGYSTQETKFTYLYFIGLCLSLMNAITTSITQVLINSLSKEAHQLVILQYFSVFAIVMAVIYQFYSPFEPFGEVSINEQFLLIISGTLGCLAQIFMNRSMMIGNVTQMSLFGESQIVFNIILDIVILKHNIGFASGFGIFLIASSLTSNILKKSPK